MIKKEDYVTSPYGLRIKYSGDFEFAKLCTAIKSLIRKKRFILTEKEYTIKDKPLGKEAEIAWNGERKADTYARYKIIVELFISEMNPAGKMENGHLDIRIKAFIELDYKNKFDSKSGKFMMDIYNNYLIKDKIKKHEVKLDNEVHELHSTIKELLNLYD